MAKRFIIAGGGTGGHIFPAIAIANALKKQLPDAEFLFVGAEGKMEMKKVPEAGYAIKGLTIAGFNRSSLLKNASLPFKLIKSFFQVRKIFGQFKPDAVIGVGGYSSFPVLKYAQAKSIPTFIHESNSFAGKSNIMLGKNATQIFTGTHGMEQFFPAHKITVTGNPVRRNISDRVGSKEDAIAHFGLQPSKKTLLVVGGSLGAKTINEAIASGLDILMENEVQLIWQTGIPYESTAKERVADKKNIWVNAFITEMQYAYAAADLVIARAGAMTVAEICVAGKPVIFVPYPYAAEDHQTANANYLVGKEAALMIKDFEAKEKLVGTALELIQNKEQLQKMAINSKALAIVDADEIIAKTIINKIK